MSSDEDIFKSTIQTKSTTEKPNALLDELDDDNFFQSTVSNLPPQNLNTSNETPSFSNDRTRDTDTRDSLATSETTARDTNQSSGDHDNLDPPGNGGKKLSITKIAAPSGFQDSSFENFSPIFKIEVKNPQKKVENSGSYMVYEVITVQKDCGSEDLKADQVHKVNRRYNDFKWLYDTLSAAEPFRFLAPLPPKGLMSMDRFGIEFVAERMSMLNDYMQTLASHPIFSASKIFQSFLTCKLDFKSESLKHLGIINPITVPNTGLSLLTNTLSNAFNSRQREAEFQDFYDYVSLYRDRINFALRVSNRVLRETQDARQKSKEMPGYIKRLAELEETAESVRRYDDKKVFATDPDLKSHLEKFHDCVDKCGSSYDEIIEFLKNDLIHFLNLQERLCLEIFTALGNRDKVQFDLQNVQEDSNKTKINEKQLHYQANYGAEDQMEKARVAHQIQALDMKIETTQKSKNLADNVVRNEIEFWKGNKTVGMKQRLADMSLKNVEVLNLQIGEYEKLLAVLEQ